MGTLADLGIPAEVILDEWEALVAHSCKPPPAKSSSPRSTPASPASDANASGS